MTPDPATRYGDPAELIEFTAPFSPPAGWHPGESERCIEIPCIFSMIDGETDILDIGTSLADPAYFAGLLHLVRSGRNVSSLDIVPRARVMNRFTGIEPALIDRIHETVGDIRENPLPAASYDLVLCVSVLEHVGFDAYIEADDTVFDRPRDGWKGLPDLQDWTHDRTALESMLQLVRPGGRLILSVPFGRGGVYTSIDSTGRHAAHLEYDLRKWTSLTTDLPGDPAVSARAFRMDPEGWVEVPLDAEFPDGGEGDDHDDMGVVVAEFRHLR